MTAVLSIVGAAMLTPVIVMLFTKWFPPSPPLEPENIASLESRNTWISNIAQLLGFLGILSPFALFGSRVNDIGLPALGLGFGIMATLPIAWICLATLPRGIQRLHEFWRFTEQRKGVGVKGIMVVYVPFMLLGLYCAILIALR